MHKWHSAIAERNFVQLKFALAFVPTAAVVDSFDILSENDDFPQHALLIANYFEDAYIGRRGGAEGQGNLQAFQFSYEISICGLLIPR